MKKAATLFFLVILYSSSVVGAKDITFDITPRDVTTVSVAETKHNMYVLVIILGEDAYGRFQRIVLSNVGSEMNLTINHKVVYRFTIDETVQSMGTREPENTFRILRLRADSKAQAFRLKAYLDARN